MGAKGSPEGPVMTEPLLEGFVVVYTSRWGFEVFVDRIYYNVPTNKESIVMILTNGSLMCDTSKCQSILEVSIGFYKSILVKYTSLNE